MATLKYKVVEEMHIRNIAPRLIGSNGRENIIGVLQPGFIIDVVDDHFPGDTYRESNMWLKDANGFYYWKGATVRVGEDKEHSNTSKTREWWFDYLQIERIWRELSTKGIDVRVAIWDTGVNVTLPGLEGIEGYNFLDDNDDFRDMSVNLHGSNIARIIKIIAPDCTIFAAKSYENKGSNKNRFVFNSFANSADFEKTDIINISYAFQPGDQDVNALIDRMGAKFSDFRHTVCAAIGNFSNTSTPFTTYPSALPNIIAVGAINKDGSIFEQSPKTNYTSFCAPGMEIFDLSSNSNDLKGTSFACAMVSGISALIVSYFKTKGMSINHREIKSILLNSCLEHADISRYGRGILDTDRLLPNIIKKSVQ